MRRDHDDFGPAEFAARTCPVLEGLERCQRFCACDGFVSARNTCHFWLGRDADPCLGRHSNVGAVSNTAGAIICFAPISIFVLQSGL
jgi:hypothetical protein